MHKKIQLAVIYLIFPIFIFAQYKAKRDRREWFCFAECGFL
jgi:hypothetical protein